MVFSSITFLFYFLPIFIVVYVISGRFRNAVLLSASLFFYAWGEVDYVAVLLLSIAFNYGFGLLIDANREDSRRWPLALGIAANLGLLSYFKYYNFAAGTLGNTFAAFNNFAENTDPVHLPLGISFFTFQAMSYLIDVYRRDGPVERNPITLALYISMFPQLIAGPIVRFKTIAKQLDRRRITLARSFLGTKIFIIGLAQKVLIANTVALPADQIFALSAEQLTTGLSWAGVICYTLQIYFDFAGYSNMAIGLGLVLGFSFPRNFNLPYVSQSITEFWRRWHISLSTWFRDYLYIPLGGNRRSASRVYANLVIVFVLCGLWHGASWTFVFWGLYHGCFLLIERAGLKGVLKNTPRVFRHAYTLLAVMIGWVFFRSETFDQAIFFLSAMFGFAQGSPALLPVTFYMTNSAFLAAVLGILLSTPLLSTALQSLPIQPQALEPRSLIGLRLSAMFRVEVVTLFLLLALSAISLSSATYNPFIYFRF